MMKTLFLLRHLKSSWEDPELGDYHRPLNSRGKSDGPRMAAVIDLLETKPSLVLCSPAERTRATLKAIRETLPQDSRIDLPRELYGCTSEALREMLVRHGHGNDVIMVIGHNPAIHEVAQHCAKRGSLEERTRLTKKYPTGALAEFSGEGTDWQGWLKGTTTLQRFVRPKELRESDKSG